MAHRTTIRPRFYEMDPYGHLNHAGYVQWFEVARVELLDEAGLSLTAMRDQGYQFVVAEIHTRFLRPVTMTDRVEISTELAELKRVTGRWRQRMTFAGTGERCAEQDIRVAVTDLTGRPTRLAEGLTTRLFPYLAAPPKPD